MERKNRASIQNFLHLPMIKPLMIGLAKILVLRDGFGIALEPNVATTIEFCKTSKQNWDSLVESFSHESNISRVYELHEKIFPTNSLVVPSLSIIVVLRICGVNYSNIAPYLVHYGFW